MFKLLMAVVLCAITLAMAQDSAVVKNAFGWDQGLSYRYYVKKDRWVGCNVTGSYDKRGTKGAAGYTTVFSAGDSTVNSSHDVNDTNETYSATIKLEAGKELFNYKKLHFDVFVGAGYTYGIEKISRKEDNNYSVKQPSQAVMAFIGFEPRVQLWDRLSLGMQFGLQGEHTWSEDNYSEQYKNGSSVQTVVNNTTTNGNAVTLFGKVSLMNSLVVLFYF